jgi:hypothetical protein
MHAAHEHALANQREHGQDEKEELEVGGHAGAQYQ